MSTYSAAMQRQAWVGVAGREYAHNVGEPITWDCTDYMRSLPSDAARRAAMIPDDYASDNVRDDPAAPPEAREWAGPFYVTVTEGN